MGGEYEVNESILKKYHSIATQLLVGFDKIQLKQLSRKDNTRADVLSMLESLGEESYLDKKELTKLQHKAARYTFIEGVLYRNGYSHSLLRCLAPSEAEYVMRQIHKGICGDHLGGRLLAQKAFSQGYYWPTVKKDAYHLRYAHVQRQLVEPLKIMSSPWPFATWGIDILNPL
ncbi:reverse transcriptase [Gossypium australe]|uniref:Reverse transcriptase n=1 Tax=Gossypium australe TaxID=47621 RepID=A0A5B6V9V7_9ROSI|nr:reverse transcriptase [Gossypium australe]